MALPQAEAIVGDPDLPKWLRQHTRGVSETEASVYTALANPGHVVDYIGGEHERQLDLPTPRGA
jgi:hypothetical protein